MGKPFWHPQRHPVIVGFLLLAYAFGQGSAFATFHAQNPQQDLLGIFGYLSSFAWFTIFGPLSLLGLLGVVALGVLLLRGRTEYLDKRYPLAFLAALFALTAIASVVSPHIPRFEQIWAAILGAYPEQSWIFPVGGVIMSSLYGKIPFINFEKVFGEIGTILISCTTLAISSIILFDIDITNLWKPKQKQSKKQEKEEPKAEAPPKRQQEYPERYLKIGQEQNVDPLDGIDPFEADTPWPFASRGSIPLEIAERSENSGQPNYQLPSIELLQAPRKVDVSELKKELKAKADLLEETLLSFGIEAKVGQIHCGPTITMFEVHPAVGVKVGKIKTLEHDIALNMEAKSIRIIAPIPGKAAVGIEIPNQTPQEVNFRELMSAYQQRGNTFKIPMLLGKAANGELVLSDLTRLPHCIIAGATGSGKSVCINSIIMSILMLSRPDEVRFLMIDPKKVELTPYTELPHMISPVITEPHLAAAALSWLVREMEKRYEILRLTGQRNIEGFNRRTIDAANEAQAHITIPKKMPYIVGIIDELADLMMVAQQDVEAPIARIAQMARAIGIHLILATQRPSREVITGLIKANFPARISCKVASRVNSQIILDDIGAETLLGNGDMLILLPGSSQPMRAQGVFVRDEEISKVIACITSQLPPNYLVGSKERIEAELAAESEAVSKDDLFEEAKDLVISTGNASTTFLQRKLKIGYARAASIMDELESRGVVGPQEGVKPRRINYQKRPPVEASSPMATNEEKEL